MHCDGLGKIQEECGELIQVAAKKSAFMDREIHPDGSNMKARIEEEIADVKAAIRMVEINLDLDLQAIEARALKKFQIFMAWHNDPNH